MRLERARERLGIEHVDMQNVDEAALAGEPVGGAPHLLGRFAMKVLAPLGRMKAKRKLWLRASRVAAVSAR